MSIVLKPVHKSNQSFSFHSSNAIYSYMNWRDLIEFRAPYQTSYFTGTNTRVLRLMLCLANGWTESQILMMHPEINANHILACIRYGENCMGQGCYPLRGAKLKKASAGGQPSVHTHA